MIKAHEELRRIHDVARELGLTARAIRYYEELGLLPPAARSEGDHRLFSGEDVSRLRTIKSLRDDAGFSLADIAELLADEEGREARRAAYHGATGTDERRRLLRGKIERLAGMVGEAEARRARCLEALARIDASVKDVAR